MRIFDATWPFQFPAAETGRSASPRAPRPRHLQTGFRRAGANRLAHHRRRPRVLATIGSQLRLWRRHGVGLRGIPAEDIRLGQGEEPGASRVQPRDGSVLTPVTEPVGNFQPLRQPLAEHASIPVKSKSPLMIEAGCSVLYGWIDDIPSYFFFLRTDVCLGV